MPILVMALFSNLKPFIMPGHPKDPDLKEQPKPQPAQKAVEKKTEQKEPEKKVAEKKEPDEDEKFHRH